MTTSKATRYLKHFHGLSPVPIGGFLNRSGLEYRSAKIVLDRLVAKGYLLPTSEGWIRTRIKS